MLFATAPLAPPQERGLGNHNPPPPSPLPCQSHLGLETGNHVAHVELPRGPRGSGVLSTGTQRASLQDPIYLCLATSAFQLSAN
jgi:hypothetical protein